MKNLNCIFIVFGKQINKEFDNLKTINTKVIPNVGDILVLNDGKFLVKK
jgi:hypothetical protein